MKKSFLILFAFSLIFLPDNAFSFFNGPHSDPHRSDRFSKNPQQYKGHHGKIETLPFGNRYHYYNYFYTPDYYRTSNEIKIKMGN